MTADLQNGLESLQINIVNEFLQTKVSIAWGLDLTLLQFASEIVSVSQFLRKLRERQY